MAEQVLVQVRVDKKLKEEVSEIYEMLGLDLPTAFRMFLVRSKLAVSYTHLRAHETVLDFAQKAGKKSRSQKARKLKKSPAKP